MRYQFLRFPEGKSKAVTFTYDDGREQDIRLSDIFTGYGLKCTFNLNGDGLTGKPKIDKDTVKEKILARGHEIAVHGYFHRAEGSIRPIEGIRDVLDCRLELEQKFGIIIRGMAYPDTGITRFANATDYETIRNYLKSLDIAYARTVNSTGTMFEMPTDWYNWSPTAHHNNAKIFDYIDEFLNLDNSDKAYSAYRRPRLFSVLGHSFEFDYDNNWEHIEKICEKLSCKDDVWYATNIEIYDYVNAYNSLVYSADGSMIYNPTLYKIWFDIDKKLYCINSGETLTI